MREDYKIVVYSTRCKSIKGIREIKKWLKKYEIVVDDVACEKPPAVMYVDDRGIPFNGNCQTLMKNIRRFKCWTEKTSRVCPNCGKEFYIEAGRNRTKYCSMDCRVAANVKREKERGVRYDIYTKRYIKN